MAKSRDEKKMLWVAKIALRQHSRLLGECSEISIVVCVFGGKQSGKPTLCEERDSETKSNRPAFLCKENTNTVKGGESD